MNPELVAIGKDLDRILAELGQASVKWAENGGGHRVLWALIRSAIFWRNGGIGAELFHRRPSNDFVTVQHRTATEIAGLSDGGRDWRKI